MVSAMYFSSCVFLFFLSVSLYGRIVECQAPEYLVNEVHKFLHKHTGNESDFDLDTWDAPLQMKKDLVYYQSGYDYDGRPVWIAEWGKWEVQNYVDAGPDALRDYDRYTDQFMLRILQSVQKTWTPDNPIVGVILIIDAEGYRIDQISSAASLIFNLRKIASWFSLIDGIHKGVVLNTNYLAERFVNLAKPVLGRNFEKFDVYGTNKDKWVHKLLKIVPRTELPEWYGGMKEFKPIKVYG